VGADVGGGDVLGGGDVEVGEDVEGVLPVVAGLVGVAEGVVGVGESADRPGQTQIGASLYRPAPIQGVATIIDRSCRPRTRPLGARWWGHYCWRSRREAAA
jgi:hypothetical protein